jgi:ubiquinone/menaquinone biosynthesis C-methylase UbiE
MAPTLRQENNTIKRELIQKWVRPGSNVLDVGCGQGGDIHKWSHVRVNKLVGIDPNPTAIEEARRRSKGHPWSSFHVGTIQSAPLGEQFDVICYNFSLQYQSLTLLPDVVRRLKPGGHLIGTVTDSTRIGLAHMYGISTESTGPGYIKVYIPDTPYYANGPVIEPVLEKDILIHEAAKIGLELRVWEPFSIYAKFVFEYIR